MLILDRKLITSPLPWFTYYICTIIFKKQGTKEREKTITEMKYRYGRGHNANDLNAENAMFCGSYHGCIAQCFNVPAQGKYCKGANTEKARNTMTALKNQIRMQLKQVGSPRYPYLWNEFSFVSANTDSQDNAPEMMAAMGPTWEFVLPEWGIDWTGIIS